MRLLLLLGKRPPAHPSLRRNLFSSLCQALGLRRDMIPRLLTEEEEGRAFLSV